jgi:hypothetical protein
VRRWLGFLYAALICIPIWFLIICLGLVILGKQLPD